MSIKGHTKKTNVHGVAKISLPGSSTARVTYTVTAPAYQAFSKKVKL